MPFTDVRDFELYVGIDSRTEKHNKWLRIEIGLVQEARTFQIPWGFSDGTNNVQRFSLQTLVYPDYKTIMTYNDVLTWLIS